MDAKTISDKASDYTRHAKQSVDNQKPNEAWFQLKKLSEYLVNVFVDLAAEQHEAEQQKGGDNEPE